MTKTPAPMLSADPTAVPGTFAAPVVTPTAAPEKTTSDAGEPLTTQAADVAPPPGSESSIESLWSSLGGAAGTLGPATAEIQCGLADDGCLRTFQKGDIYWVSAVGANPVWGANRVAYLSHGAQAGGLRYPTGAETCGLRDGGCTQTFQGGQLFWSPATGSVPVWGANRVAYLNHGAQAGGLRYPTGAETCGLRDGGCTQTFQGGQLFWSPATGSVPVWGANRVAYLNHGAQAGGLRYPTGAETCALRDGGCTQSFQGGQLYWSPATGSVPVWGANRVAYLNHGAQAGGLRYPTGAETCGLRNGGCTQSFQGGKLFWSPAAGSHPIWGAIGGTWLARGGPAGSLGYPTETEKCWATGCQQWFENGSMGWSPTAGAKIYISPSGYCEAINRGSVNYGTGGAQRVTFAIAEGYAVSPVTSVTCVNSGGRYVYEWSTWAQAGESGFARPGVPSGPTINKYSPTGSYTVTDAFGLGNPGTALNYQTLNQFSRWGGRLNANYNKYFESSADIFPDENMWYYATRPSHDYRQGVVINYNRPPDSAIVMDAGFAIFLHANRAPSWGCIAMNEGDVVRFMTRSVPGDRIVMGVVADVFR
ncbi:L,D-transpeptidase family protein [Arthrobacter rhizosphaerae]|uniref:L,D-transpeptidase family protein n=1 Tax=Arthrobacter rhizosphaerae TaxID=2855490 RepID=UPI001FF501F8|nr:L,D-transpeptidase family protein [Arthrobacter rhizosphaerae]